MPATAGRVRMPHGNRVSSSSALKMTGIWTNTIGYDPYAAEGGGADAEDEANAYEQAKGLMALARLSNQGVSLGCSAFYFLRVSGNPCSELLFLAGMCVSSGCVSHPDVQLVCSLWSRPSEDKIELGAAIQGLR